MKKVLQSIILTASLLAVSSGVKAIDFDPTIAGQTTLTIECTDPVERTDGSTLDVGEIVNRKFYVDANGIGFVDTNTDNPNECKQVFDMTKVVDGTYIYSVTAIDSGGRESVLSPTRVTAVVKRLPNPNSPSAVTGTRSQVGSSAG